MFVFIKIKNKKNNTKLIKKELKTKWIKLYTIETDTFITILINKIGF